MSLTTNLLNAVKKSFNSMDEEKKIKLKDFLLTKQSGSLKAFVGSLFFANNIDALISFNLANKLHWYGQHYHTHFATRRNKKLNILEIGIGGYSHPKQGGSSLRVWRTYFPNSRIYGIDIYDKSYHDERRIKTFKGSQVDTEFLTEVINTIGQVDIIIDDGSHLNEHVITSFEFLFPKLSENGIYVIEDVQTSYWPSCGGSSEELNTLKTSMGYFKNLIDGVNCDEFKDEEAKTYYDKHIVAISFYHNMIFIQKGLNNQGSNIDWKKLNK